MAAVYLQSELLGCLADCRAAELLALSYVTRRGDVVAVGSYALLVRALLEQHVNAHILALDYPYMHCGVELTVAVYEAAGLGFRGYVRLGVDYVEELVLDDLHRDVGVVFLSI